jgi:hypothetical protein
MAEIQAIPEPLDGPDFDTLGDERFDREVEEALWKPKVQRAMCGYCSTLGCPACAHAGLITTEESQR